MQVVVREPEAHQDAGYPQLLIEEADDGDGAAGTNVDRLPAKDAPHRLGGGADERIVGIDERRRGQVNQLDLRRDAPGAHAGNRLAELLQRFLRQLVRDQPHADLRGGARRDHGLGSLARKAAADAVDLQSRPGPETLEQRDLRLANQFLYFHLLVLVLLHVEWQTGPGRPLLGTGRTDAVVESRNQDVTVAVL